MPQIIVTSDPAEDGRHGSVMLRERINAADFESAHFKQQLIERLGWAVGDAQLAQHHEAANDDAVGDDHGEAERRHWAGSRVG